MGFQMVSVGFQINFTGVSVKLRASQRDFSYSTGTLREFSKVFRGTSGGPMAYDECVRGFPVSSGYCREFLDS